MGRIAQKNFCVEARTGECICDKLGCGGIDLLHLDCPEHGSPNIDPIMHTHFHPIQVAA